MSIKKYIQDNPEILKSIRQGVERECLRVQDNFKVAMSDHPAKLGSKLTHPFITTDYSENLIEYITSVYSDEDELLANLHQMHSFTYKNLENSELIWPMSMPAIVPENENDIKVANYGTSNPGRLKELYRVGLGHRYGKSMQSIAGVHYNFSFDDDFWKIYGEVNNLDLSLSEIKNLGYFHLIRNYRRYSSILVYLFGATPVVHESFLVGKKHKLEKIGKETFGKKFATSLRMGGLGYTSNAQENISICYNALETYIKTLEKARQESYPAYEKIGLKDESGSFKQLNTNLLQIDNEFYSTIRPKNIAKSGESALGALYKRGIEYIEVRLLDVNPFSPVGIDNEAIHFLHSFLLFCLCSDSPKIDGKECHEIDSNFNSVVNDGLREDLELNLDGKKLSKQDFFNSILNDIDQYASLLDKSRRSTKYSDSLKSQKEKVKDESLLFSKQILDSMGEDYSLIDMMAEIAIKNKKEGLDIETDPQWESIAIESIQKQKALEDDLETFDEFHARYFNDIKINFEGDHA